jgi:hypothetical protein
VRWSPLALWPQMDPLYQPLMTDDWQENGDDHQKTGSNATLCSTNPIWTTSVLNLVLCGKRLIASHLRYGIAKVRKFWKPEALSEEGSNLVLLIPDWLFYIKSKLHGLSLQANYTDRLSDRRLSAKLVPTLADRGCRVVSATIPPQSLISVF